MTEILCGIDWASDHHDVALIDPEGNKLGRRRIRDNAAGLGELTSMFAEHGGGPGTVKIAIETERGLLVASLRAAGYQIYPINPKVHRGAEFAALVAYLANCPDCPATPEPRTETIVK